jgi:pyruvate carboxylase subunit B
MMRDNNMLDKFTDVIKAMREVVEKGGYGTSVTPVSQFYFQQAFNNVVFGPWTKIADGYGKMVLGYFGKTPVAPDDAVVKLAAKQLKMDPTTEHAIDLADKDETKSLAHVRKILETEGLETTEENLFIAAACKEKGIAFLKGEAKVNVRKEETLAGKPASPTSAPASTGPTAYTVVVNGQSYNVQVAEGENVEVTSVAPAAKPESATPSAPTGESLGTEVSASLPGAVFKILVKEGQAVSEGEVLVILEAMKMEIEIPSPASGTVTKIKVSEGQAVENGQVLVIL